MNRVLLRSVVVLARAPEALAVQADRRLLGVLPRAGVVLARVALAALAI